MPSETVELVRRLVEAFNREDLAALAELSDDELEFASVLTAVDAGGSVFRGPHLWPTYFEQMHETWERWHVEDVRIFDAGDDRAAAVFQIVGKGKHSGVPVEQTIGITYEIRRGKLWRMRSYRDATEALDAAGLASSQDNVEIVRRAYAALAEQGVEGVLPFTDPQFEVTTPPSLASEPDTYRGHEGLRRYLSSFDDAMEGVHFEGREFTPAGDKVLVDTMLHARGRTTQIETEQRAFLVFTLRKGRVTTVETFAERSQALEAAGLSNREVARRMWDAFLEGDLRAALSFSHPDIEWDGTNLPDGQVGRGHEAVLDHIKRWADQWEAWTVEVEEIIDAGEGRVVVMIRERGRSKSGAEMDELHAELYDLRDGLVVRRQGFSDPREALEAVGLSE